MRLIEFLVGEENVRMLRAFRPTIACLAGMFAMQAQVQAAIVSYSISVKVTAAPNAPGAYVPWSFTSLPSTFVGTFDADDTVAGAITNLSLSIGGIDIFATHPLVLVNSFDPATRTLNWISIDPSSSLSAVSLGSGFGVTPSNYAVGIDSTFAGPEDPYLGNTQNWVGTFTVNPVPEPSTLAICGIGACAAGIRSARRRRSEKLQESKA